MSSKKLTIKDIAKLCNVGKSTVSRVINQKSGVNQATRNKVKAVIAEHGFVPSNSARGLKGQSRRVIAVIVTRLDSSSEHFALRSILKCCQQNQTEVIILESLFDSDKLHQHLRALYSRDIAGVIIFSFSSLKLKLEHYWQNKIIFISQSQIGFTSIVYDNKGAVEQLFDYFYAKNHRYFAYFGIPDSDLSTGKMRNEAYLNACKTKKIPVLLYHGDLSYESGYLLAQKLFAKQTKVEVILCATDTLALGAMRFIQEHSIACQLGYIGSNLMLDFLFPMIVSVDIGFSKSGKLATQLLFSQIEKTSSEFKEQPQKVIIPAQLKEC